MKKDVYIFPVIVDSSDSVLQAYFPDFPQCRASADTLEDVLKKLEKMLGIHLFKLETANKPITEPTPLSKLPLSPAQLVLFQDIDMRLFRNQLS